MTPLTHEQALAELRKFAGVQFDPVVVDAFVKTHHVDGVADPGRRPEPRQIPLIAQVADRMTLATGTSDAPGATTNPASPTAPTSLRPSRPDSLSPPDGPPVSRSASPGIPTPQSRHRLQPFHGRR